MSDYGHRLIVPLIDQKARETPDAVYCQIPTGSDFKSGMRHVTWAQFARAIDQASWWLEEQLGKSDGSFPTISFIGLNSPLYFILAAASIKTGYKILFNAPRNSVEAQLYLFDQTDCKALLRGPKSQVQGILAARDIRCITTPSLDDLLGAENVKHYPYTKTYEEAKNDPTIVLHSSGSTGPPKPIVIRNGAMTTMDAHHMLPDEHGYRDACKAAEGSTVFIPMPCFHAAGVMWIFFIATFFDVQVIFAPIGSPLNVSVVDQALDTLQFDWMFLPPSICEDISREESMLPKLKKLRYVIFSGGPLSQELGDVLHKYTRVVNLLGSTEEAIPPYNFVTLEDWNYLLIPESMKGVDMRPREDGLHEMYIVRDPSTDPFHSTFYTFPNDKEYATKDLFARHPTKPYLWQHRARSDDVLVLSNGEKVVPIPMEAEISKCPQVSGALVVGHARFETAALIEMDTSAQQIPNAEKLAAVADYIERANDAAPGHARISRDRIIFTSPDKPMLRAGKGTILRKATLTLYESEIEDLYAGRASLELSGLPLQVEGADVTITEKALRELLKGLTNKDFQPEQDFFATGLDSLQVLNVVRQLKAQLSQEKAHISPNMVSLSLIYSNSTVSKLAKALHAAAKGQDTNASHADERKKAMREMYLKYSHNLPHRTAISAKPKDDNLSVILTGSTGSLGSYLLDELLSDPKIKHVYCFNRSADAAAKQKKASASRGLSTDFSRVTFEQTNPDKERFGIRDDLYPKLLTDVSYIIHNQWAVDFNMALPSFEPHIRGVRYLIDLSAAASKRPPILFTSTIDTTRNWIKEYPSIKTVPEKPIHNPAVPSFGGYGEGKYVGERLLEAASEVSGISANIVRSGQIAGPVEKTGGGVWNVQEWFPTIIKSSKHLGMLPDSIGSMDIVDWIPVDLLARVVIDLMHHDLAQPTVFTTVNHLVNPKHGSWRSLLPTVQRQLDPSPKVVPTQQWVEAVQKSASMPDADANKNPAIKLLDFYENMAAETRETCERSGTLKEMPSVTEDWMGKWMEQWRF
ncbi:acetyl-CoA synthetase-like protein [Saccharata proteae CBS 121410]|uniref:Acetyl-CoA synthetase-like protein n=1 Tax=Saccharata proteae CBS 121410 TaxID=1314787 RepID=A0A9P4HPH9_9PEZI|nr:acetyl-CoA synthetase-like protein [Saccharata proteae CBS 121410]